MERDMVKWRTRSALRLIEAAISVATKRCKSRIEDVQVYSDGYAEPGYSADVIATGNWNTISHWDDAARRSVDDDDTPKRLANALERIGVAIEWSDEWTSCSHCNKLVRTSADSYSWTPSYTIGDGELTCVECLESDPESHLESLEGNPDTANTLDSIDPTKHGYVLVEGDFESGFHRGQDADPHKVAKALEEQGITRYLFQIDNRGQFDLRFSVYVHESEADMLDREAYDAAEKDGPSNAEALERGLREAARVSAALPDGEGIKYVAVQGDKVTDARVISPEDFVEKGIRK